MEKSGLGTFISDLSRYHVISPDQQENTTRLIKISTNFLKKAKLGSNDIHIESENTVVLECGHQPNFLPHAGTWKKAFFLNQIHNHLIQNGNPAIAFFGLADQNISTARLLSKNQIPDLNKNGFTKIGFKIKDTDKLKSFNKVDKPAADQWQKEIDRIQKHYQDVFIKTKSRDEIIKKQWDQVLDILWTSYDYADNFAELNSVIFARICRELFNINISFFLYSDMYDDNLFLEESKNILRTVGQFNQIYNQEIARNHLDIPPVRLNHLPFWYECECGVKLDLVLDSSGACEITCPVCLKKHILLFDPDFGNLEKYFKKMDFTAVSRNIIMAHGLGVTLFLSGTGGSSVYGRISDRISTDLGFHRPLTLAWQSQDHYLGMMQKIGIWELMKTFSIEPENFISANLNEKIGKKFITISQNLEENKANNNQKDIKYWNGLQNSAKNLVEYTQKIFSNTPSFIDLLTNFQQDTIIQMWENAINNSEVQKTGYQYRIRSDINYPVNLLPDIKSADLPAIYASIKKIGVR
jgi:hypothetical protein